MALAVGSSYNITLTFFPIFSDEDISKYVKTDIESITAIAKKITEHVIEQDNLSN